MRKRIVGLTVLAAVLATLLFGIPLAVAAARYFVDDERTELQHVAEATAVAASGDLRQGAPVPHLPGLEHDVTLAFYDATGTRVGGVGARNNPPLAGRALRGHVAVGSLGGDYAVAVPVSDGDTISGAVVATADSSQTDRRIALAWMLMLGLAAAAVTVAWLVARRQAKHLTAPLEAIRRSAERLGDGDFSARTESSGIAELDSVGSSLDKTAVRIARLLDRERSLAADLSHQLRTPLTGLRLGIEAALENPECDFRAALEAALAGADRLEATVGDLLALARDSARSGESLDLDHLLDELQTRWHGVLAAQGRPLRIQRLSSTAGVAVSHACARQITEVLLDNASAHGRGEVTVRLRDVNGSVAIDVADQGPELIREPSELFVRRSPDATGTGIGLALARTLAEAEGGRLTITSRLPPTFTVFLPGAGVHADQDAGSSR